MEESTPVYNFAAILQDREKMEPHQEPQQPNHPIDDQIIDNAKTLDSSLGEAGGVQDAEYNEKRTMGIKTACERLYGRNPERRQLLEEYHPIRQQRLQMLHSQKQNRDERKWKPIKNKLVLISGSSGTGKTVLIRECLQPQLERDRGHLMEWHFCPQSILQVLPGFHEAMSSLVKAIEGRSDEELDMIRKNLQENNFDFSRAGMITKGFPSLKRLLVESDKERSERNASSQSQSYGFDYNSVPEFVKGVSCPGFPIVYWFDDFHFIPANSLYWLKRLLNDVRSEGVFVVMSYNSDKLDKDSEWYQCLEQFRNHENVDVEEIHLNNLDSQPAYNMALELLGVTEEEVDEGSDNVAEWIVQQTKGNPLYMEIMLPNLFQEGMLRKGGSGNASSFTSSDIGALWILDKDEADCKWGECHTVHEYLSTEIRKLPSSLLEIFKVAACLGSPFNSDLVSAAMSGSVVDYLEAAVGAQILVRGQRGRGNRYKFINNSMHEAAMSLFESEADKEAFHLAVGCKLIKMLSEAELEKDILTVSTQLIYGVNAIKSQRSKYDIARTMLQAARQLVHFTSFSSASRCAECGLGMLNRDSWRDEYELTLALHNAAAEIAYANGSFGTIEEMFDAVSRNARRLDDRLQVLSTKLYMLESTARSGEAIKLALETLEMLGEKFPKKPMRRHIVLEHLKTKRMLRGKSDEDLLNYPTASDNLKVSAMKIMNVVWISAFLERPLLAALIAMRMVQLSLKHGYCAIAAVSFGNYGMLLCSFGSNFALGVMAGVRFGNLALRLLDRFQSKEWIPRVYFAVYGFIQPWVSRDRSYVDHLIGGYRVGLDTGDIEYSMLGVTVYLGFAFDQGKPLGALGQEIALYKKQMATMQQHTVGNFYFSLDYVLHHLMGGQFVEAVTDEDLESAMLGGAGDWVIFIKIMVSFILCDYEKAVESGKGVIELVGMESVDSATYYCLAGLAHIARFKETGRKKRRHVAVARHFIKKLVRMTSLQTRYCLGKLTLLQAELSSLSPRRHNETMKKYLFATSLANTTSGIVSEGAIGHERFGRYLKESGDSTSALVELRRACELYHEWNAFRKADMLKREIGEKESFVDEPVLALNETS